MSQPRAVTVSVQKHEGACTIDEKRVKLPFTITAICPICGKNVHQDLSGNYHLSYPTIGASQRIDFHHVVDDEDHEFYAIVQIDVTISVLPPP